VSSQARDVCIGKRAALQSFQPMEINLAGGNEHWFPVQTLAYSMGL
jgi:hypothetical protein